MNCLFYCAFVYFGCAIRLGMEAVFHVEGDEGACSVRWREMNSEGVPVVAKRIYWQNMNCVIATLTHFINLIRWCGHRCHHRVIEWSTRNDLHARATNEQTLRHQRNVFIIVYLVGFRSIINRSHDFRCVASMGDPNRKRILKSHPLSSSSRPFLTPSSNWKIPLY